MATSKVGWDLKWVCSDEDDYCVRPSLPDQCTYIQAAGAFRKLYVDKSQVRIEIACQVFNFVERRGLADDTVTGIFDHRFNIHRQKSFVLDNQHIQRRLGTYIH
ncbi:hypothetical protein ASE88_04200 [Sphingomonas sp. Leaf38]|nr:hypothetical protein ASE88_04200 [Sphingomonas sp. Leaf38]